MQTKEGMLHLKTTVNFTRIRIKKYLYLFYNKEYLGLIRKIFFIIKKEKDYKLVSCTCYAIAQK